MGKHGFVLDYSKGKIIFKTSIGILNFYVVSAFEIDGVTKDVGGLDVAKDANVKRSLRL